MATPTYDLITSNTLTSNTTTVSFTSLPTSYVDLRLVIEGQATASSYYAFMRFNNDSSSTYRAVWIYADSSGRGSSGAGDNKFQIGAQGSYWDNNSNSLAVIDILDYRGSTKNRSMLCRFNKAGTYVDLMAGQLYNTSTVTSIQVTMNVGQFASGTTMNLYGIVS